MRRYFLAVACAACVSSLPLEQHAPPDAASACCAAEDSECSLLQVRLVPKVVAEIYGGAARLGTEEAPAGAPYPSIPSDATLTLAKMAVDDAASQDAPAHRAAGHVALLMERLSAEGLRMRPRPLGPVPEEYLPVIFYAAFLVFLVLCFFLTRRKRLEDAHGPKKARTIGTGAAAPCLTPDFAAPQAARRAFNLMTGSWEDAAAHPPEKVAASTPPRKAPKGGSSRVRARSSTRDAGRRGCAEEVRQVPRATTLDSPGDARSIVGLVMSHGLVVSHAPCGALKALRAVREVLAAAGGEQPLRLGKADLLARGITPQCFELLHAAGLRDVGRGLVLTEASGPKLQNALAAVDEALRASSSALAPLPAVQVLTDAYGSYVEEEVFTYN